MLGKVGPKVWQKSMKIVGNSKMISLMHNQIPLVDWLEKPQTGCCIILGKEVGDQELYQVKATVLHMMESSECDMVEVIQPSLHIVYSASWFYNIYSQWKHYLFSKQAM